MLACTFFIGALYVFIALLWYTPADIDRVFINASVSNSTGPFGAWIAHFLRSSFGLAAYTCTPLLALTGLFFMRKIGHDYFFQSICSLIGMFFSIALLISTLVPKHEFYESGGYIGFYLSLFLINLITTTPTTVIAIVLTGVLLYFSGLPLFLKKRGLPMFTPFKSEEKRGRKEAENSMYQEHSGEYSLPLHTESKVPKGSKIPWITRKIFFTQKETFQEERTEESFDSVPSHKYDPVFATTENFLDKVEDDPQLKEASADASPFAITIDEVLIKKNEQPPLFMKDTPDTEKEENDATQHHNPQEIEVVDNMGDFISSQGPIVSAISTPPVADATTVSPLLDAHTKEINQEDAALEESIRIAESYIAHKEAMPEITELPSPEVYQNPYDIYDFEAHNFKTENEKPFHEKSSSYNNESAEPMEEEEIVQVTVENDTDETIEPAEEECGDSKATAANLRPNRTPKLTEQEKDYRNKFHSFNVENYVIPSYYFEISKTTDSHLWKSEISKNSELLVKTLENFGIEATVSKVNRGPVITLYEIQIAAGIKVNRISNLSDDIAMALAALRIRIVAPIPGKSAIGVEVPNKIRDMVTTGDLFNDSTYRDANMQLKVGLGKDISGKPVMIDLKKQPHLLIAGATGSGKSVCVNTLITSLVFNYDPDRVRFIMVDPKMVELQLYNGLPHQLTPVITEPDVAPKALKWAIYEMERRYRMLSEINTRDIERYNQKVASYKGQSDRETLPYIVIIVDELADLMMVAPKEIENYITRIAQKARAVGIHLVLATQRPSVDVITGIIKANFPARIAFQVAQKTDSRTILDQNGAETLLGKGDMLYQSPNTSFPVRIQGAFISEDEVIEMVRHTQNYGHPHYIDIKDEVDQRETVENEGKDAEQDELFVEAIEIVEQSRKASASYLQRRLSIGYNRAARIVERMEELGYVGPQQGSKPREVLI